MTLCNTLNVKLFNWQLNQLKSGPKNGTKVTLKLSSNVFSDYNVEGNFPRKLVLTNTHSLGFVKLLQIKPQLIQNCKLNWRKYYNQEDF